MVFLYLFFAVVILERENALFKNEDIYRMHSEDSIMNEELIKTKFSFFRI